LGRSLSPERSPGNKRFWTCKPSKMHTWSINFISFTDERYNALHMQGKKVTLVSWGPWPLWLPKSTCALSYIRGLWGQAPAVIELAEIKYYLLDLLATILIISRRIN